MKLYAYAYKSGFKVYRRDAEDYNNKILLGYIDFKEYQNGWEYQKKAPELFEFMRNKKEEKSIIYAEQCEQDCKNFRTMFKAYYTDEIEFLYFRITNNEQIAKSITDVEREHINLLVEFYQQYFCLSKLSNFDIFATAEQNTEFQRKTTETGNKLLLLGYSNLVKRQS